MESYWLTVNTHCTEILQVLLHIKWNLIITKLYIYEYLYTLVDQHTIKFTFI